MSFVDSSGLAVEQLELRHAAVLDANTGLTWTNAEDRRRRQVGQLAASSTLCKKCLIRSILDPSRRPMMTPDSICVVSRAAGAPLESGTRQRWDRRREDSGPTRRRTLSFAVILDGLAAAQLAPEEAAVENAKNGPT